MTFSGILVLLLLVSKQKSDRSTRAILNSIKITGNVYKAKGEDGEDILIFFFFIVC